MDMWYSYERLLRGHLRLTNIRTAIEYGPGKSTEMILDECPKIDLVCVEHELKYLNKIKSILLSNGFTSSDLSDEDKEFIKGTQRVTLLYRTLSLAGGKSSGYVTAPYDIHSKYDFAFIDGRQRVDCINLFRIMNGGFIVVHDIRRSVYHEAINRYPGVKEINQKEQTAIAYNRNMKMVEWIEDTVLIDSLENMASFFFVRFGDGELICIDNPRFGNKRHQPIDGKLSAELKKCLHNQEITKGMVIKAARKEQCPYDVLQILKKYVTKIRAYKATMFHLMFLNDHEKFFRFVDAIRGYGRIGIIGGPSTVNSENVRTVFNIHKDDVVVLSDENAYDLLDENQNKTNILMTDCDLVILAAGWASNCIAQRAWELDFWGKVTLLDIGSTLDAIAGRNTRSWIGKNQAAIDDFRTKLLARYTSK